MNYFENALKKLLKTGIEVNLVISPTHCIQYAGYKKLDIWDQFKCWKENIVLTLEEIKLKFPDIKIYDFAVLTIRTMENIPKIASKAKMFWFIDSNHYSREYGNEILNIIHHETNPTDLYVLLSKENIKNVLQKMDLYQHQYETLNRAQEVAWISQMYNQTKVMQRNRNIDYYDLTKKNGLLYRIVSKE